MAPDDPGVRQALRVKLTDPSVIRAITEITLSRQRGPDEYRAALSETQDAIETLQGLIERLLGVQRRRCRQSWAGSRTSQRHPAGRGRIRFYLAPPIEGDAVSREPS